jgi:transcriptional regulator with XRE-family HTH domain
MAERRRVGETLRQYRVARGLSQERLGEAIGADRRTISTYERGTVAIDLDRLTALARVFGVESWQLLYPR